MDLKVLLSRINEFILNPLIALLFAIALIVFLWGVAVYILQSDNPQSRSEGSRKILWGVIGMFIMASVWGIMWIIVNTFSIDPTPIEEASM